MSAQVVKRADLDKHLPQGVARCSPEQRRQQNAARLAAYTRRTGDLKSQFLNFD